MKTFSRCQRRLRAALPGLDRPHTAIELTPAACDVAVQIVACHSARTLPRNLRARILKRLKKLRQQSHQPRTNHARAELCLREKLRWHDHIRIHRPERNAQLVCDLHSPLLRNPQRIFIANHHRGVHIGEESQRALARRAPHHEPETALCAIRLHVSEPVRHERIVAQIRMRKLPHHSKVHNAGKPQRVRHTHRSIERMVVPAALCALHPVHDATSARRSAPSAHRNTRVLGQPTQILRHRPIAAQLFAKSRVNSVTLFYAESHLRRTHPSVAYVSRAPKYHRSRIPLRPNHRNAYVLQRHAK